MIGTVGKYLVHPPKEEREKRTIQIYQGRVSQRTVQRNEKKKTGQQVTDKRVGKNGCPDGGKAPLKRKNEESPSLCKRRGEEIKVAGSDAKTDLRDWRAEKVDGKSRARIKPLKEKRVPKFQFRKKA